MNKEELMMRACQLAEESVRQGGGPFGAVIARNGEIIAEGSNCYTTTLLPMPRLRLLEKLLKHLPLTT